MREKAIVIEEQGDHAKVRIVRSSACAQCRRCAIGSSDKKEFFIWSKNPLKAKPGQTVEVELKNTAFFQATIIAYLIPLIAFLIGITLGYKIPVPFKNMSQEIFALIIGILVMSASFMVNYLLNDRFERSGKFISKITNILT